SRRAIPSPDVLSDHPEKGQGNRSMSDLLLRADAIRRLLSDPVPGWQLTSDYFDATLQCCLSLDLAGFSSQSINLLSLLRASECSLGFREQAKLDFAIVRSLYHGGQNEESLAASRGLQDKLSSHPMTLSDIIWDSQILEGASLWHLHRPEEAMKCLLEV